MVLVVPTVGAIDTDAVMAAMRGKLACWQYPDDVVVVDALSLTATGKIDKKTLRVRHQGHLTADAMRPCDVP